jgi:hypothetical protein
MNNIVLLGTGAFKASAPDIIPDKELQDGQEVVIEGDNGMYRGGQVTPLSPPRRQRRISRNPWGSCSNISQFGLGLMVAHQVGGAKKACEDAFDKCAPPTLLGTGRVECATDLQKIWIELLSHHALWWDCAGGTARCRHRWVSCLVHSDCFKNKGPNAGNVELKQVSPLPSFSSLPWGPVFPGCDLHEDAANPWSFRLKPRGPRRSARRATR